MSEQGSFTTTATHIPAAHRAHVEWTPTRLIHWGESIGPATAEAVTRLMAENRHPEHGYRACLGLLSLSKRYGKVQLEADRICYPRFDYRKSRSFIDWDKYSHYYRHPFA
jgi:hypothetical protein